MPKEPKHEVNMVAINLRMPGTFKKLLDEYALDHERSTQFVIIEAIAKHIGVPKPNMARFCKERGKMSE